MPHHSDVFAKMDALMKKHHPGVVQPLPDDAPAARPASPAEARSAADIPVLTDIVAEAEPEIPVLMEVVDIPLPAESRAAPVAEEVSAAPLSFEGEDIHTNSFEEEAGRESQDMGVGEPIPTSALPLKGREGAAKPPELPLPGPAETSLLTEQAAADLETRIREELAQQLVPPLAAALEKSLAGVLDQFAVQLEYLIRDAITAEVRQQLAQFRGAEEPSAKPKESAD